MTNHILNRLTFEGNIKDIQALIAKYKTGNFDFDFHKIVPETGAVKNSFKSDRGSQYFGIQWRVNNWGTPWNSYANEKIDNYTYQFRTKSYPPHPIVKAIAFQNSTVHIIHEWFDENNIGSNIGIARYALGQQIEYQKLDYTKKGVDLMIKLCPSLDEICFDGEIYCLEEIE